MSDDHTAGALLVGAGNIGALYDIDSGPETVPLTHLSALAGSPRVGWIDVVEADPTRIQRLEANCKVRRCVQSLKQLTADSRDYGIACVATPSDTHFTVLQNLNDTPFNIGHVLCEKPLFSAPAEFRPQVSAVRQMKFPVTVNYPRTWSRDNTGLIGLAVQLNLGAYTSGVASYGKGLKNNGSHMINLLLNLFGGTPEITSVGRHHTDDLDHDPTVSFSLVLNGHEIAVTATSSKSFSLFELDLRFERGRIVLKDGGRTIECHTPVADPDYPGYKILGHHMTKTTDLGGSMQAAIDDVIASPDSINLEQAIITADTYFRVEEEFNQSRSAGINV